MLLLMEFILAKGTNEGKPFMFGNIQHLSIT